MTYSIASIQTTLNAAWEQQADPFALIEYLLTDSRQLTAPAVSLFFALPGKRHDGHVHLADAYRAGVRNFVVSRSIEMAEMPEANVLRVPDTLRALQALAAHHRAQFHFPVVGITGSNGKTIVKEWLYQLLAADYQIVRSPKSYNSQIGVPLSVWQIQARHTLGLFEAGISLPGEMAHLARIIRPDIGIFTTIGSAHREGFISQKEKIGEKMQLFAEASVLIYCCDHEKLTPFMDVWAAERPGRRLLTWSKTGKPADVQVTDVQPQADQTTLFAASFGGGTPVTFHLPFADPASVENALHCLAFLYYLDMAPARMAERLARMEPVEMRLELKAAINRCTLINDAYNNDIGSLRIALQFAAQQARTGRLTLVLSDILQSGQPDAVLYEKVAAAVLEHKVRRLIGIGTGVPAIQPFLESRTELVFFPNTDEFLQEITKYNFEDELILLKGARPFTFERIARRLELKAHKTVMEINLTALVHNLNVYNRLLRPGTRMLAMVKAAGYGSGPAEVAKLLEFHKIDYLGVAYTDEGIELRQAGVQLPILVLNPEPSGFDALYRYRLEPEVYSLSQLDELVRFTGREKNLAVHIKLDTGMHRLGFEAADIPALAERLVEYPNLTVRTVFTHLSASDAPEHDAFTHRQAAAYTAMYAQLAEVLGYRPIRHIVNTGGIHRFPEYHFDMVRLGIGLYGIDSTGLQDQLKVVNTLKATISQVKVVQPGETVGYNRNGPVLAPSRIATISIGYADGFLRLAGNGRYAVLVHGKAAPTIGNVCMDMTMIDVTNIPEAREGDEVVIFGENHPVQGLARTLQSIPYEVLTNISERVKRVYWQEG